MSYIKLLAIGLGAGIVLALIISTGIPREEKVECYKLQAQAKEYPQYDTERDTGYFITEAESEMCARHQIEVDAYVK
jgi:hypothetical protein